MNRRTLLSAAMAAILLPALATPQAVGEPGAVEWRWTAVPVAGSGSEPVYELRFTGQIAEGFIVYASDFDLELGPRPTRLRLEDGANVIARGKLQSSGAHSKNDPVFKGEYRYFAGTAQLAQQVQLKNGAKQVKGALVGQTCREADGTCQLFNQRFEIALPPSP